MTHRVLVVEDDPDTMLLMRLVLRNLPVELIHVSTGSEALSVLQQAPPDLVFLDLNLPDMRGWDVLEQIKNDPDQVAVPVIVLTSHAEPVHRLIGNLQPIRAYLNKPVQADQLRQHVRAALSLP
jgi:CheY-like chemotaxis protein